MRQQRSGHIIQISSVGGRIAVSGSASYHASKWAVGGFTEALAREVAPFGVKGTALEPGRHTHQLGKRAFGNHDALLPEYEATVGEIRMFEGYWGNEAGDPAKVAKFVLKLADADILPPHILLGGDALNMARPASEVRAEAANRWETVSRWTDVGSVGPLPPLPTEDSVPRAIDLSRAINR